MRGSQCCDWRDQDGEVKTHCRFHSETTPGLAAVLGRLRPPRSPLAAVLFAGGIPGQTPNFERRTPNFEVGESLRPTARPCREPALLCLRRSASGVQRSTFIRPDSLSWITLGSAACVLARRQERPRSHSGYSPNCWFTYRNARDAKTMTPELDNTFSVTPSGR